MLPESSDDSDDETMAAKKKKKYKKIKKQPAPQPLIKEQKATAATKPKDQSAVTMSPGPEEPKNQFEALDGQCFCCSRRRVHGSLLRSHACSGRCSLPLLLLMSSFRVILASRRVWTSQHITLCSLLSGRAATQTRPCVALQTHTACYTSTRT